ncbi:TPA: ACT domain-containing protein [Candidatus Micrarchaeota archaeon]|nr:ACT domain-containing protein [Candidatus Micrarchaeota archaeon]
MAVSKLVDGKFYQASVDEGNLMTVANYLHYVVDVFREDEGLSIVFMEDILEEMKELSIADVRGPFAMVSVDSGLKAASSLEKEGIEMKAFSAYQRAYIFVPYDKKEDAMRVLEKL